MDYASPILLALRRVGQRLGVLRPMLRAYRRLVNSQYEEAFDNALLSAIRPGDTVWDVGAHKGYYTAKFADIVGETGKVVAFEPSPQALPHLTASCGDRPSVSIQQVALSDYTGEASFSTRADPATDSLRSDGDVSVPVRRGEHFARAAAPNVIKIDVEGFEPDVLRGMGEALRARSLRAVLIEVHFLELAKRGLRAAPSEIVRTLSDAGFKVRWLDPSHLVAVR